MNEYYIDSNVFLRVILNDHKTQSPECLKIFKKAENGEVSLVTQGITICEVVWVLTSLYKISKKEIIEHLQIILFSSGLRIIDKEVLIASVSLFEKINADFIDCYVASWMKTNGINKIISFDQDFEKFPFLERGEKV